MEYFSGYERNVRIGAYAYKKCGIIGGEVLHNLRCAVDKRREPYE